MGDTLEPDRPEHSELRPRRGVVGVTTGGRQSRRESVSAASDRWERTHSPNREAARSLRTTASRTERPKWYDELLEAGDRSLTRAQQRVESDHAFLSDGIGTPGQVIVGIALGINRELIRAVRDVHGLASLPGEIPNLLSRLASVVANLAEALAEEARLDPLGLVHRLGPVPRRILYAATGVQDIVQAFTEAVQADDPLHRSAGTTQGLIRIIGLTLALRQLLAALRRAPVRIVEELDSLDDEVRDAATAASHPHRPDAAREFPSQVATDPNVRLPAGLVRLRSELRERRVRQLRLSLSATDEDSATALADYHYSGLPPPTHGAARAALARTRRRGLMVSNTALRDPHRRLGALLQTLIVGRGPIRQANFHELVGLAERAREARARGQTLRVHRHPRGYRGPDGAVFEGSSSRSTPLAEATGRFEVTSVNEIRERAVTDRSGRPRHVPNRLQALEWSIFDRIDSKIGPEGQIRSDHPEGLVRRGQVDVYVSSELGYSEAEIREAALRATRNFHRRPAGVQVRVRVVSDSSNAAIDDFLWTGVLPRPRTLHAWGPDAR